MAKQPSDAGKNERKAGLRANQERQTKTFRERQTKTFRERQTKTFRERQTKSLLLDLIARIEAMRNATEATVTTPAPPARDQNKMLPPDHGPTTWLLL